MKLRSILLLLSICLGIYGHVQADEIPKENMDNTDAYAEKSPGGSVYLSISNDVQLHPSLQIGAYTFRRLISLASENESVDSKGYRLQESFKAEGGIGLGIGLDLGSDCEIGFGLMGIKGRSSFSDRFIKNAAEVKAAKPLRIPKTVQDLSTWKTGDRLVYSSLGGVLVKLGYIFSPVGITGTYLVSGEWATLIQKDPEEGWVTVELSHLKTKSVSVAASFPGGWSSLSFASLSASWFRQLENETVLRFNLHDFSGMDLFSKAIHGNWKAAQEAAQKDSNSVRWISSEDNHATGRLVRFKTGVPLLFSFNHLKGRSFQESTIVNQIDGTQVQNWISGHFKENITVGILSNNVHRSLNVIGISQIKTQPRNSVERNNVEKNHANYFGQISFSYEKSDVESSDLKRIFRYLTKLTGIYKPFEIKWTADDLGYVHIHFTVNIDENILQKLLSLENSEERFSHLLNIGKRLYSEYDFQKDSFRFCSRIYNQKNIDSSGIENEALLLQDKEKCKQTAEQSFKESAKTIREKLHIMKMNFQGNDEQNQIFAEALSYMSKEFIKSPFIFQAVQAFTKELATPLTVELKIEGSNFGKIYRNIQ